MQGRQETKHITLHSTLKLLFKCLKTVSVELKRQEKIELSFEDHCDQNCIFLSLQTDGDTDIYTLHTRVPEALPVVDVEATSPAAIEKLTITLGEVCFAQTHSHTIMDTIIH